MKQTQDQQVLEWILTGTPLTQYDGNYRMKPAVSRVPSIINRLEKNGWKGFIQHKVVTIKKDGVVCNITSYRL